MTLLGQTHLVKEQSLGIKSPEYLSNSKTRQSILARSRSTIQITIYPSSRNSPNFPHHLASFIARMTDQSLHLQHSFLEERTEEVRKLTQLSDPEYFTSAELASISLGITSEIIYQWKNRMNEKTSACFAHRCTILSQALKNIFIITKHDPHIFTHITPDLSQSKKKMLNLLSIQIAGLTLDGYEDDTDTSAIHALEKAAWIDEKFNNMKAQGLDDVMIKNFWNYIHIKITACSCLQCRWDISFSTPPTPLVPVSLPDSTAVATGVEIPPSSHVACRRAPANVISDTDLVEYRHDYVRHRTEAILHWTTQVFSSTMDEHTHAGDGHESYSENLINDPNDSI